MNGLLVAGITASATVGAVVCYALWWALNKKRLMPTFRLLLMLGCGSCVTVAFGVWIVKLLAALRSFGTGNTNEVVAALIVLVFAAVAIISAVFVLHAMHPKHKPDPGDERAAFILPIALVVGVGGALGAVGDSIVQGTSDATVNLSTMLVGGNGKSIFDDHATTVSRTSKHGR